MTNRTMVIRSFVLPAVIILLIAACGRQEQASPPVIPSFSTYAEQMERPEVPPEKREMFYGLLTPIEVANIFNRLNIPFNQASLNPTANADYYLTSAKMSLNLGVYGVNLGYLKIFGKNQEMLNYMLTLRNLASSLNVPEEYLLEPIRRVESDLSDPDSIMVIMNRAYRQIEDHLREYDRESTAGLMLMGGWVEAMYLATQLAYDPENPDPEVIQKISEQKYTLNTLLTHMKNYYDDPMVVFYTKKLLFLKRYFDTFNIYFKADDVVIDTNRQVIISTGSEMTVTLETLNNIRDYIEKFRTEIVSH